MALKIKSCMEIEKRTPLKDVIPLDAPFSLQIELSSYCNFKCKFCVNGDSNALKNISFQRGIMKFDTYKKVIDDLDDFDQNIKVLLLSGTGESLMDNNIEEKIIYAKKSSKIDRIHIITNGSLFTPDKCQMLIDSGIDRIVISLYGMSSEQMFEMTGTKINFEKYIKNIQYLCNIKNKCDVIIKFFENAFSDDERKRAFEIFEPITDYIYTDNMYDLWPDHQTDTEFFDNTYNNTNFPQVCSSLFYTMLVNSDGTCPLCCVDWKHEYNIGDSNTNSIKEIWESQKLFRYQRLHLEGKKNAIPICKNCKDLREGQRDNIDDYREELLMKLLKKKEGIQ